MLLRDYALVSFSFINSLISISNQALAADSTATPPDSITQSMIAKINPKATVTLTRAPIVLSNGNIVATSGSDGMLYFFNSEGKKLAEIPNGISNAAALELPEGKVLVDNGQGKYRFFNLQGAPLKEEANDGRLNSVLARGVSPDLISMMNLPSEKGPAQAIIRLPNGQALVATQHYLAKIEEGQLKPWLQISPTDHFIGAPLIRKDGSLVTVTEQGRYLNFTADGTLRSELSLKSKITAAPILLTDGSVAITTESGTMKQVLPDGTIKNYPWVSEKEVTALALPTGGFAQLDRKGILRVISKEGQPTASFEVKDAHAQLFLLQPEGHIAIATATGLLKFYSTDGLSFGEMTLPELGNYSEITQWADGRLAYGSQTGKIIAIKLGQSILQPSPVPTPSPVPAQIPTPLPKKKSSNHAQFRVTSSQLKPKLYRMKELQQQPILLPFKTIAIPDQPNQIDPKQKVSIVLNKKDFFGNDTPVLVTQRNGLVVYMNNKDEIYSVFHGVKKLIGKKTKNQRVQRLTIQNDGRIEIRLEPKDICTLSPNEESSQFYSPALPDSEKQQFLKKLSHTRATHAEAELIGGCLGRLMNEAELRKIKRITENLGYGLQAIAFGNNVTIKNEEKSIFLGKITGTIRFMQKNSDNTLMVYADHPSGVGTLYFFDLKNFIHATSLEKMNHELNTTTENPSISNRLAAPMNSLQFPAATKPKNNSHVETGK